MAEYSSFFNSFQGDRRYTAAQFAEYFASFIGNGVFWGGNAVKVNAISGMDIRIETGKAFINGYYYDNKDAYKRISLEASDPVMPRIDRVVLRLDLSQTGRLIHATVKKGEPSNTPTVPLLRRDNAIHELGLADIRVNAGANAVSQGNITDLRLSSDYCGIVAGLISQPDLTEIFNQYWAKIQEVDVDWDTWLTGAKNDYLGWFSQIKAELYAQASTSFDDWSRHGGYNKQIDFLPKGDITETLVNRFNGSMLAYRTTEFVPDGNIKETLVFNEPPLETMKLTTFNADGSITETIS